MKAKENPRFADRGHTPTYASTSLHT